MNNMPARIIPRAMNQHGFTLLEVLIALLILSIGLLGLAALQTTGLRSNTMATTRTHATQLAYDIADRMRANVAGSYETNDNNVVQQTFDGYGFDAFGWDSCPNPPPDTPTQPTTLDPLDWAEYDLTIWCSTVVNMLPGGDAMITQTIDAGVDGTAGTSDDVVTYDVTVYWDEARTGAEGKNCGTDPKVDLRCMRLNVTIPRPIPNA